MFSPPRILKLSFFSKEGVLIIRVLLGPDFEHFEVVQFLNIVIFFGLALHLGLGILGHFHNLVDLLLGVKRPLFPVAIKLFRLGGLRFMHGLHIVNLLLDDFAVVRLMPRAVQLAIRLGAIG